MNADAKKRLCEIIEKTFTKPELARCIGLQIGWNYDNIVSTGARFPAQVFDLVQLVFVRPQQQAIIFDVGRDPEAFHRVEHLLLLLLLGRLRISAATAACTACATCTASSASLIAAAVAAATAGRNGLQQR